MKKIKTLIPWLIATALFIALTPAIFTYAEAQDNELSLGGDGARPLTSEEVNLICKEYGIPNTGSTESMKGKLIVCIDRLQKTLKTFECDSYPEYHEEVE